MTVNYSWRVAKMAVQFATDLSVKHINLGGTTTSSCVSGLWESSNNFVEFGRSVLVMQKWGLFRSETHGPRDRQDLKIMKCVPV
jgi:hypothetical protein